ncbi:MAG: endolytic transglycosylase MltG [Deltaproteobacteria bacterium]|nr:endolytic transglycosylase MltG [Deltaproteobacteria bacterium]
MKKFFAIFLFLLLAASGYVAYQFYSFPHQGYGPAAILEIKKGMGIAGLTQELKRLGLTSSTRKMDFYLRYKDVASHLKAGEYEFGPNTTPEQIAEKLIKGERLRRMLTIPEGYSLKDIAKLLSEKGWASADAFLKKAQSIDAATKQGLEGTSLEGYLFPDTYEIPKNVTEDQIIQMMTKNFKKQMNSDIIQKGQSLGLSRYQILTLASIIEKETGKAEERPLISSVFHNRLKIGMPLATDPTVIYGIPNFDGNIRRVDLERDTPYNTYLRPGLPPTPISNPGLKSLQAAVNPTPSEYLYFVSKGDGSHQFSKTLEEHQAAVQQYQIAKSPSTSTQPTSQPTSR